ncbi:hypothetical protein [Gloeothece citriformis]|nr:hypothetical protein [Gloeothece citriformis]
MAISYYFLISFVLFIYWLKFWLTDSTTPKTHLKSWLILMVGTSLWPLVLPFAYLELLTKISQQRS